MRGFAFGFFLSVLLVACAANLPMPTMPPLTTDAQRDTARACQQTYATCQAGCSGQNLTMALGAQQIHERTKCVNNCKQVLSDCYVTIP